jgi:predicted nucleotide-binding protein
MAKSPAKTAKRSSSSTATPAPKRAYVKQSDVPMTSLEYALRMPQAILDHYAGKPVSPLQLAKALEMDPKGSQIRVLSGAAIAFGLVEGGAQATSITVTPLARRILRPRVEGEDIQAKREAVLLPRVFGDFLRQYDGNAFPRQDIALNVLEDMGVPREKTAEVLERIDSSARSVGFIEEIKGKTYVTLQGIATAMQAEDTEETKDQTPDDGAPVKPEPAPAILHSPASEARVTVPPPAIEPRGAALTAAIADDQRRRRVFITHGKNRDLVDPIRKLLEYGELEPVISVDRQSVSKPVPEKVMDDMRASGAAIIHVDADRTIVDKDGSEHVLLNPNVLIEIGAAMAFYGRRFILLVRDGVKLPSNLQGLYEVRYTGDNLDAHATIKLLEAIKDIKNHALPTSGNGED